MNHQLITEKQKSTLDFIIDYYKSKGYTPTLKEISNNFNISIRAAFDRVGALIRKNYITRNRGARTLVIRKEFIDDGAFIPLIGEISAGLPLESPENIDYYLPFDQSFFPEGDYFALNVKGDSMLGAGILPNDIVIIKKQNFARNKDIIVAMLEGETTVKRVFFEDQMVILKPENDKYPIIRRKYINILGCVVALLRRFQ
ncbi:repressor LexA [bacterium]|nr:repressor LexA [bacterium]